ncbi:MAG: LON peptidase substrate-binding domain-containing protein, partial [Phycisphaerales bacterium]|nr:LON peptidase substrate-binding domain-containing protein [Phycisphaerales bacterium]
MPDDPEPAQLDAVPLFPLPQVVLFPRALLPLHVFEFRYRVMTADALAGARRIAMALLRPGWEKEYHGRPAIEPVVCVGRILSSEQLPDGKYNLLLQGTMRAAIDREYTDRPYRYASLSPIRETSVLEIDLGPEREQLRKLFESRPMAGTDVARQFLSFLDGPMPTADVADLAAFHLLQKLALKQQVLADGDVRRRV